MRLALSLLLAIATGAQGATLAEYMPHASGDHVAGMLIKRDSREWASMWVSYGKGMLEWRDPAAKVGNFEFMSWRDGWLFLDKLDQWPIRCIKAEIEIAGIVLPAPCDKGHPYSPANVLRDPIIMRAWIDVGGQKAYWQSEFIPGVQTFNPCWYQGERTVETILQRDSWWSANGGWVRATGTPPYDAQGRPRRPVVTNAYEVTLAKGVGVWTINDIGNNVQFCAYSTWSWQ